MAGVKSAGDQGYHRVQVLGINEGARPAFADHQALKLQGPYGFPDGASAYLKLLSQHSLGRQPSPVRKHPLANERVELLDNVLVEPLPSNGMNLSLHCE